MYKAILITSGLLLAACEPETIIEEVEVIVEKEVIVEVDKPLECTSTGVTGSAYHYGTAEDQETPVLAVDVSVIMCNTVEGALNKVNVFYWDNLDAPDEVVEGTNDKIEVIYHELFYGEPEIHGIVAFPSMYIEQCHKHETDSEWTCGNLTYVGGIQIDLTDVQLLE